MLQTIDSLYAATLSSETVLQQAPAPVINAILIKGNQPGTKPTVFDLLAHDASYYYSNDMPYISRPDNIFRLKDEHVLANANDFIQYDFITKDSASHLFKALQLFQQLVRFHERILIHQPLLPCRKL